MDRLRYLCWGCVYLFLQLLSLWLDMAEQTARALSQLIYCGTVAVHATCARVLRSAQLAAHNNLVAAHYACAGVAVDQDEPGGEERWAKLAKELNYEE